MANWRIPVATLLLLLVSTSTSSLADVLCVSKTVQVPKNGQLPLGAQILVAKACNKNQKQVLDTSSFVGPAGAQGKPGDKGGKGEPGAAGPQGEKGDAGATGQVGAQGLKGDKGDKGDQGNAGERGQSAFDTLPSGVTVRGVFHIQGVYFAYQTASITFPAPIPEPILFDDVIIARTPAFTAKCGDLSKCLGPNEINKDHTQCTGSPALPTAPAGKVCIYPITFENGGNGPLISRPFGGTSSLYGFQLLGSSSYSSNVEATWAYTAP